MIALALILEPPPPKPEAPRPEPQSFVMHPNAAPQTVGGRVADVCHCPPDPSRSMGLGYVVDRGLTSSTVQFFGVGYQLRPPSTAVEIPTAHLRRLTPQEDAIGAVGLVYTPDAGRETLTRRSFAAWDKRPRTSGVGRIGDEYWPVREARKKLNSIVGHAAHKAHATWHLPQTTPQQSHKPRRLRDLYENLNMSGIVAPKTAGCTHVPRNEDFHEAIKRRWAALQFAEKGRELGDTLEGRISVLAAARLRASLAGVNARDFRKAIGLSQRRLAQLDGFITTTAPGVKLSPCPVNGWQLMGNTPSNAMQTIKDWVWHQKKKKVKTGVLTYEGDVRSGLSRF